MEFIDVKHMVSGVLLVGFAILALVFEWPAWFSYGVVFVLSAYSVFLLLECAHRSRKSSNGKKFFALPNKEWALLLVTLFVATNVVGFANIYVKSASVEFEENKVKIPMTDKWDAVYFSAVTVTTLGYGEFTPKKSGRILVLFHLASGLLLLLVIIPVAAARVSDWES